MCEHLGKDGIQIDLKTEVWAVDLICVGNGPSAVRAVLWFLDQLSKCQLRRRYTEVTGRSELRGTHVHERSLLPLRVGISMWCLGAAWCAISLLWSSAGGPRSSLASTLSSSSSLMLALSTNGSRILLPGESTQKWALGLTLASRCWWVNGARWQASAVKCMGGWGLKDFGIWRCIDGSGIPRNFVRGGVQKIQLRTEDRENRDMGAVAP